MKANNLSQIKKGSDVKIAVGSNSETIQAESDPNGQGEFFALLSPEKAKNLGLSMGGTYSMTASFDSVASSPKDFSVDPQSALSIESVGGDNVVSNAEFSKPIEVVLKAENIKGIEAGTVVQIQSVDGANGSTSVRLTEAPNNDGVFKVSLDAQAIKDLGFSWGGSYSIAASIDMTTASYQSEKKPFSVSPLGKLSIVSVGGDDNEVDNVEFAKPIEIVLKAEHIEGIQAGRKIRIAVGGKTVEVEAEGVPDPQTGLFKASLSPDQAHGASNSLGLSMGARYSMTASIKFPDLEYTTADEKAFEVLAQGRLSIVSVGGSDNKVDNAEYAQPIEIVLKAENIKGIQAGKKIRIAVGGKTAEVAAESAPDSDGLFKTHVTAEQAQTELGLVKGQHYTLKASIEVSGAPYDSERGFDIAPEGVLTLKSVGGSDNSVDPSEFAGSIEVVLQAENIRGIKAGEKLLFRVGNQTQEVDIQTAPNHDGIFEVYLTPSQAQHLGIVQGAGKTNYKIAAEFGVHKSSDHEFAVEPAPTPSLSIDSVAGDGVVDNAEFAKSIDIVFSAKSIPGFVDGSKVIVGVNGASGVIKSANATGVEGQYSASLTPDEYDDLQLTQGKTGCKVTLTFEKDGKPIAESDPKTFDIAPANAPTLSIVRVSGDNRVDYKEFGQPVEIVLKAVNISGLQAHDPLELRVGDKTVTVSLPDDPNHFAGEFAVSLSAQKATDLGLEQGKSYSIVATIKGNDSAAKDFVVDAKPELAIQSVGGDDQRIDNA